MSRTQKSTEMPMSTTAIVVTTVLISVAGIAIWYFAVAYKYGQTLNNFSYTRGANLDTLDKNKGVVNMQCESGAEICVWRANAICSGPLRGSASNTEGGPEPISNGLNGNAAYGDFDVNNTIDLTTDMSTQANGKQNYQYNFDVTNKNFGGKTCPMNYDVKSGTGSRPQLIATYACIPKGSKCQSSKPPTPPTPPPVNKFTQVKYLSNIQTITTNNNNQICGSQNSSGFKVQCVDNYNSTPQLYTIPGYLSDVSLSDTGSLLGVGSSNNVYYLNDFKTNKNWTDLTPTVQPNLGVTNRFGTSGTLRGTTVTDTYTWKMPKNGSVSKLSVYGWSTIDSNANGDLAGIAYGNVQYLPSGSSSPLNVTTPQFNPVGVSINKSGGICALTDKGDIMCSASYNQPSWKSFSSGQNFKSLSINDSNTICASKSDGTVWCT